MKYRKFTIKNFKGIENLNLDLTNNRIITFVGLNESGKTTIMEALNLFYSLTKSRKLTDDEKNSIRPKGIDFTGKISINGFVDFEKVDLKKLEDFIKNLKLDYNIELPTDAFTIEYNFIYKLHTFETSETLVTFPATAKYKNEKGTILRKKLHEYDNKIWNQIVNYIESDLLPEILYYEDFIFNIPEDIIYRQGEAQLVIDEGKNIVWQLVLDDIIKTVNPKFGTFKEMVVDIWNKDNDTALNRISQIEEVLNQKITNSWKALFQNESGQVNFKEIEIATKIENSDFKVSFKVKTDSGKLFSIKDRSKGCRWFFSFLIFTEFRKSRTNNILFLLDEPASNLHSSAQSKILEAIYELSQNSIVIYSTHSHHLINPKWLTGTYIVINDKISDLNLKGGMTFQDSSKISALKYFNYVGQGLGNTNLTYFQPILDALDYSPSNIEATPNLILTEGKSDWYAFNYINEVILKRAKLNFYPGGGRDSLYNIIRLYTAWGSNFIILLDGDEPSIKSKKNYLKEFEPFLDKKVYTIDDILNTKSSLEDLFSDEDVKKLILENFSSEIYNKAKESKQKVKELLNSSINLLAYNKKYVELSIETKNRFAKIFDFLIVNIRSK